MRLSKISQCLALAGFATCVAAQQAPDATLQRVEITGSSIKRIAKEGSLPVQVITADDLKRQGIVTADQVLMSLNGAGNGMDNLATNSDVGAGSSRGNNGLSAANLRNQGAASTLVLLNGRRVAVHGLSGGVVDLNSIPMAAVDRIEILKDGASAIYGTDAIGGVINFILKKNFNGVELGAFTDHTQHGGANIERVSFTAGFGNLEKENYNVLLTVNHSHAGALRGDQRDFVNTFQPDRGLSVDTRGTPFATVFAISSLYNALSLNNTNSTGRGTGPTLPGSTQTYNGINALNLPGGAGCSSIDGMAPYDAVLWASPASKFGCAWDTGRAATLQQPLSTTSGVLRGTFKLGEHQMYAEYVASNNESAKVFSANQITSSTSATSPFFNLAYPKTGASYDYVFNLLVKQFPQLEANRGQPLAMRWRCMPCGSRQIDTSADTSRLLFGVDGPVPWLSGWDYKAGISSAESVTNSLLGDGYFYGKEFAALINTGVLNPFLLPGQVQTPEALAALKAVSANGTTLYGGKSTLTQMDASATGPVFKLPAGDVMAAVGVDSRTEKYRFNGNATDLATQARIFNAPFDSINTLDTVKRDVRAVYGEVLVPVTKQIELTAAARHDDYTGFGGTTNPKVSMRFTPVDNFLMRGSYNTGFRVPTFSQLFFGVTESPYSGKDLVDPSKCAGLKVDTTKPGCESITPTIFTGGKSSLQPEKSKQWTFGFVWAPTTNSSVGADWWSINRTGTVQSLSLTTLLANASLFPQNFLRDTSGNLVSIDQRWVNAGETATKGVDINAQANTTVAGARLGVVLEGTYLIEKKSRLLANVPFGPSEIGKFNAGSDIGLRWKHTLTGTYSRGEWVATVSQIYRSGYVDAMLPGVANGSIVPPNWTPNVEAYTLYNLSVGYTGFKHLTVTGGIKNLFDKNPPFATAYDGNTGAGSSWDPRVADPRGRSFTLDLKYQF